MQREGEIALSSAAVGTLLMSRCIVVTPSDIDQEHECDEGYEITHRKISGEPRDNVG